MAPAKTPVPILDEIHREVKRIVMLPEIVEKLDASGVEELVTSREEHAKVLKEDLDKYAALMRGLNLVPAN
jgi:tripartite-type tricarboxylate transporter receptor subunit TctC